MGMDICNLMRIGGSPELPLMAGEKASGKVYVAVVPEGERPSYCTWKRATLAQTELWCKLRQEYIRNNLTCPHTEESIYHCRCGWH